MPAGLLPEQLRGAAAPLGVFVCAAKVLRCPGYFTWVNLTWHVRGVVKIQ